MALRKVFPTERKYDMWNILMCFLIHDDDSVSDKERSTFGMLSYRLMSKAAEALTVESVRPPSRLYA